MKLDDIEGIGSIYSDRLRATDIHTIEELLEKGCTRKGRKHLAEKTGISGKLIMEWVNLVDLKRIKGIGEEYTDLMEETGVDTVKELAHRVPENLYKKLVEVNKTKKMVRRLPSLDELKNWIEQAKKLPAMIEY